MRVANIEVKNHFIDQLQGTAGRVKQVQVQMSTGQRMAAPSEDPVGAINSVYHRSRLNQVTQFQKNVGDAKSVVDAAHDHLGHVTSILQRVRELAVQGAQGTYTGEDRQFMALEVEELLREGIKLANTSVDDNYLFSGGEAKVRPFREFESTRSGLGKPLVEQVEYLGNQAPREIQIGEGEVVRVSQPGSEAFWGQNHLLVSLTDAREWVAGDAMHFQIDGHEVRLTPGDQLDAVVQKINEGVPSVHATAKELPGGQRVLALESSSPHRMQLDDLEGGQALQQLGLIRKPEEGTQGTLNIHPNTLESGGSIFDIMIRFRNSLLSNDSEAVGSRDLESLSAGLENVLLSQAKLSSVQTRMDFADKKLAKDSEWITERLSKNEDVDMAEASIRFNQLDMIHRISLMTAARLIPPTLLDFVR